MQHPEFLQYGRQWRVEFFKIFEREDLRRNLAEDGSATVFLIEKVGAEPRHVGDFIAEVHVTRFFVLFDFVVWRDLVEHRLEPVVLERRVIDPVQFAVDTEHGRIAGGEVQVRGFLLEHQIEESINFCHKNRLTDSIGDFLPDLPDYCKQCYCQP